MNAAPRFRDAAHAGGLLAEEIARTAPLAGPSVVLGVGEEGAQVARPVGEQLGAEVHVLLVSSLGLPWRPRLCFGAVTEDSHHYVDPEIVADVGLGLREIAQIARARLLLLRSRAAVRPPPRGMSVVVVCQGLSTGYAALAAVASARAAGAADVLVAAPTAASDAARRVAETVRLVTLYQTDVARFDANAYFESRGAG